MYPNQQVKELRKSGKLEEALKLGQSLLKDHPDDRYLKSEVGWVLHDRIKDDFKRSESQPGRIEPSQLSDRVRLNLREYARLDLPRPDLLFSRITIQAFRLPDAHEFLTRFLMWAGLEAFQHEDFRSWTSDDGRAFEPLVVKVALKAAKWARDQDEPDIQEFL